MKLVLMTPYFGTLKDIGGSSKSNVVMVPSSPYGVNEITSQIQKATIVTNKIE